LFVATVGVAQVILLVQIQLPELEESVAFPTPIDDRWTFGNLTIRGDQLLVLIAVPLIAAVFAFVMQRTKFGLSVRSAADNPSAASLAGIRVRAVSTQVWIVAGILASVSALLATGPQPARQRRGNARRACSSASRRRGGRHDVVPARHARRRRVIVVDRWCCVRRASGTHARDLNRSSCSCCSEQSGRPTVGLGLTPRALRPPGLLRTRWPGSCATRDRVPAPLGLLLPQFETHRAASSTTRPCCVPHGAVSATVLTRWAGQLSLGSSPSSRSARLTSYCAADLSFLVSVGLGGVGREHAVVIGIALRMRGLYLGIITLGPTLTVSRYVILRTASTRRSRRRQPRRRRCSDATSPPTSAPTTSAACAMGVMCS
jgi:hypothetical protein